MPRPEQAERKCGNGSRFTLCYNSLRTELNMGQYLDVVGTVKGGVLAAGARMIVRHKTAGYTIVRPLQLGAALAGRPELAAPLAAHGEPLGTAYQLRVTQHARSGNVAWTQWLLGRALADSGHDPELGLRHVAEARDALAALGDVAKSEVSDVDQWLAARAGGPT